MRIDRVWHFMGPSRIPSNIPEAPFDLTMELLDELSCDWDVMIHHLYDRHKDHREYVLALDHPERKFRQR